MTSYVSLKLGHTEESIPWELQLDILTHLTMEFTQLHQLILILQTHQHYQH